MTVALHTHANVQQTMLLGLLGTAAQVELVSSQAS